MKNAIRTYGTLISSGTCLKIKITRGVASNTNVCMQINVERLDP